MKTPKTNVRSHIKLLLIVLITIIIASGCQKKPHAEFKLASESTIYTKTIFTNTSSEGDHYEWDFGDGTSSTDFEPAHQYQSAGKYTVKLTAYSENGKKTNEYSKTIDVTRWHVTKIIYTFGVIPTYWGDSVGCFEPSCDTLNGKIAFYAGAATSPTFLTPLMPMGDKSTNSAQYTVTTPFIFTNENWRIDFIHQYSSGAGYVYSTHTFNPVTTPDNGLVSGDTWEHIILYNKANVGISLALHFQKRTD